VLLAVTGWSFGCHHDPLITALCVVSVPALHVRDSSVSCLFCSMFGVFGLFELYDFCTAWYNIVYNCSFNVFAAGVSVCW